MKRVTITAVFDVEDYDAIPEGVIGIISTVSENEFSELTDQDVSNWTSTVEVTDPPREWKFGDIVTKEDHPDGYFVVIGKEGYRWDSQFLNERDWADYGPYRLVAIDLKVLD